MKTKAQSSTSRDRAGSRISKDGKWRSFDKVPHLLQYVPSGNYYARVKVDGKVFRETLETKVWTTAKLKLVDFLREKREKKPLPPALVAPTFAKSLELYKTALHQDHTMKEGSKGYRLVCIRKIEMSWPELWPMSIDTITPAACREWAAKLRNDIAPQYFNNTIATLRLIIDEGIRHHVANGGMPFPNPATDLKRARIGPKELKLPERAQFRGLVEQIRKTACGWNHRAADLVEFLAYSGLRLKTEAFYVTWEDVDWERKELIVRGAPKTATKNWEIRRVPVIKDLETLLTKMKTEQGGAPTGKLLQVAACAESLKNACAKLGISRISHHDLRHLFATRCIESGVDIPTVARWLGHKDGGALAMRTYGHLRNEHSQQMAQKVVF